MVPSPTPLPEEVTVSQLVRGFTLQLQPALIVNEPVVAAGPTVADSGVST